MFYSLYSFFTKQINVKCYNVVGEKTMAASQDEIKVWNKKAPVSIYVLGKAQKEMRGMSMAEVIKISKRKIRVLSLVLGMFFMLDGRVPDEGACVELGIAYASGKRCYGFKSDARSIELDMDLNPMISGCFIKTFYNLNGEELIKSLEEYLKDNEL